VSADEERYYTIQDVARLVGVHQMTVRRWVRRGTLPSSRFGGVIRISADDLAVLKQRGYPYKNGR